MRAAAQTGPISEDRHTSADASSEHDPLCLASVDAVQHLLQQLEQRGVVAHDQLRELEARRAGRRSAERRRGDRQAPTTTQQPVASGSMNELTECPWVMMTKGLQSSVSASV